MVSQELEEKLLQQIREIGSERAHVDKLKESLIQSGVLPGDVQKIINEKISLSSLDFSLIYLLTSKLYSITDVEAINPNRYFTEEEIEMAQKYNVPKEDKEEFPIVLNNVIQLTPEDYITSMNIKKVVKLFTSNLFVYNFETQRNAKFRRKGEIVLKVPRIEPKSVKEISQKVLDGTFYPDMLTFNVLAGTARGNYDEILYNTKKQQLIINESEIDILDGFHRINGFLEAMSRNPQLDIEIPVTVKNYNIRKAQSYIAQVNTINRIDPVYLKSLKSDRYSDYMVQELQRESDLRGRISETGRTSKVANHLVSYNVLADTIEEVFADELKTKKDAMDIAKYLVSFFDYLLGSFPEEFISKVEETSTTSLINNNNIFVGYIVLAKRMKTEGIHLEELYKIIQSINFNKTNPLWQEYQIIEEDKVGVKSRKNIMEFFTELDLKKIK